MSKHETIRRYALVIEKIKSNHYPHFESIKDYLTEHGFEISKRTLQRDIEHIRNEFGLELVYQATKKGYYIDYESSINTDSFFRFLEMVSTADLLTQSLKESKDTLTRIIHTF